MLHQGKSRPVAVLPGDTVGGRGIELQLSRIGLAAVKFFGRPTAADPGCDPGAELAQRIRRQSDRPALYGQRRRPRHQIGPRDGQEPQLAIGLFHAQGVTAVASDDLDSLAMEGMDGQPDGRRWPARGQVRPGGVRQGFGSAVCLSLSGATGAA